MYLHVHGCTCNDTCKFKYIPLSLSMGNEVDFLSGTCGLFRTVMTVNMLVSYVHDIQYKIVLFPHVIVVHMD